MPYEGEAAEVDFFTWLTQTLQVAFGFPCSNLQKSFRKLCLPTFCKSVSEQPQKTGHSKSLKTLWAQWFPHCKTASVQTNFSSLHLCSWLLLTTGVDEAQLIFSPQSLAKCFESHCLSKNYFIFLSASIQTVIFLLFWKQECFYTFGDLGSPLGEYLSLGVIELSFLKWFGLIQCSSMNTKLFFCLLHLSPKCSYTFKSKLQVKGHC